MAKRDYWRREAKDKGASGEGTKHLPNQNSWAMRMVVVRKGCWKISALKVEGEEMPQGRGAL